VQNRFASLRAAQRGLILRRNGIAQNRRMAVALATASRNAPMRAPP